MSSHGITNRLTRMVGFPSVEWTPARRSAWVATRSDQFVGMVEEVGGSYVANDTMGGTYTTHRTLAEAKRAFDRHLLPSRASARRGVENYSHRFLAPFLWGWFRDRTQQQSDWRYPTGPAEATVPGPLPVRVLVIGDGPAAGCGVLTHELGMAGSLARDVAARTGRGAVVTVHARPAASARSSLHDVGEIDLGGYDSVVLMLASTDGFCLTPCRSWRRDLSALVSILKASGAAVYVTSTASLHLARSLSSLGRWLTGSHARMLDGETERICEETHTPLIGLDAASDLTSRTYAMWGRRIGGVISGSP